MNINQQNLLVLTDLNGTILDRATGSAAEALPALNKLRELNVPVIFNSSKPAEDIISIRATLNNVHPFISENGAALYLPHVIGSQAETNKVFGMPRNQILHVLAQVSAEEDFRYLAFSTMSAKQITSLTGLQSSSLDLMLQREYTEALYWQDSEEKLSDFSEQLSRHSLQLRRNGDIVQILVPVNKATPFETLLDYYRQHYQLTKPLIIALGDGALDLPMFAQADIAVLIKGGARAVPTFDHDKLLVSQLEGPAGWNQVMLDLLT